MKYTNRILLVVWACLGSFVIPAAINAKPSKAPPRVGIMESYPKEVQGRLEARERDLQQVITTANGAKLEEPVTVQYVLDLEYRWDAGSTLTVAFAGGTPELRAKIEQAASEWSKYCSIKFSFRENGKFREWSPSDTTYKARVRIGFADGGYWSALGKDSIDLKWYPANEASMNFEGFTTSLPPDYAATVKHEFGHALAFWHEHQHPQEQCDNQLRWTDDAGYVPTRNEYEEFVPDSQNRKPGIYTVFGGPPNNWDKEKVDSAMKHISDADTHAYKIGTFDKKSIMKYYYYDWLFLEGERSRCYSLANYRISAGDRAGAAAVYGKTADAIKSIRDKKERTLENLLQLKGLSPELKQKYQSQRAPAAK